MQRPACRCSDFEAQGPRALAHLMPPHLSVCVHMHPLEFGRASSTGGLLVQSLGGRLAPLEGCEEALAAVQFAIDELLAKNYIGTVSNGEEAQR